jgi:hypothetical protein
MPQQDQRGQTIRFGCGAALGACLGFFTLSPAFDSGAASILATVVVAVGIGSLARRYGDRFWEALRDDPADRW